jgi:HAD superfamily hydrolase (TIGR01509 family)
VHDLPLKEYLTPNPTLRSVIASLPTRNLIFTNADIHHAKRVLNALELSDLFETIVDVNTVAPYCKPMPESFQIAMKLAGETDPSKCVMIDDIHRTTRAASEAGMFSILYHETMNNGAADAHLTDWNELIGIWRIINMENPAAFWGALFFIVLIAGANFMMYAIVRGVTRSGNKNFLETLSNTLNPNSRKKDESMQELRQRIQELEKSKKDQAGDSE